MGIYRRYVLPRLINLSMQNQAVMAERATFVPLASGKVLEVGIGSGLNIPFYSPNLDTLYGVDPSLELWKMARGRADRAPFPIEYNGLSGENIPITQIETGYLRGLKPFTFLYKGLARPN
jgi:hypothetical protein